MNWQRVWAQVKAWRILPFGLILFCIGVMFAGLGSLRTPLPALYSQQTQIVLLPTATADAAEIARLDDEATRLAADVASPQFLTAPAFLADVRNQYDALDPTPPEDDNSVVLSATHAGNTVTLTAQATGDQPDNQAYAMARAATAALVANAADLLDVPQHATLRLTPDKTPAYVSNASAQVAIRSIWLGRLALSLATVLLFMAALTVIAVRADATDARREGEQPLAPTELGGAPR